MQDLIDRLMAEGLTEKQAYKAIEIIKKFCKGKVSDFSVVLSTRYSINMAQKTMTIFWMV
jgi:hypothetical protein